LSKWTQFKFQLWLVKRQIKSGGRFLAVTSTLAFIGMVIGVACLVLSMGVVSGFETTLKKAVIDVTGHLMVMKSGGTIDDLGEIVPKIKKILPDMVAYAPFFQTEALIAKNGKTSGVVVQGIDLDSAMQVLNLSGRIVQGSIQLGDQNGVSRAVLGKALAKKFGLRVGDIFQVVAPRPSKSSSYSFSPRSKKFLISGILDLGKYEYDLRFVMTSLQAARYIVGKDTGFSGIKIRLKSAEDAPLASQVLMTKLGYPYWSKDWVDMSRNLFEAIKLEKVVIFVVLLFMIITACFNICSTLFVNVLKRYADISILKAMGASPRFLMGIFSLQGFVIGFLGSFTGIVLGWILSVLLAHSSLFQVSAEIYKLDHLTVEMRFWDIMAIVSVSLIICLLSTLAPALRGARMNIVDGLRYE